MSVSAQGILEGATRFATDVLGLEIAKSVKAQSISSPTSASTRCATSRATRTIRRSLSR